MKTQKDSVTLNNVKSKKFPIKAETCTPEETIAVGHDLAHGLCPGDVVALEGDLGSGKTTFVKGIAAGLGAAGGDAVTSPTFTLMHVYHGKIPVYHFDLYRLDGVRDLEDIGFGEFVQRGDAVLCVEWPEKASAILPGACYWVKINMLDRHRRSICITRL